MASAKDRHRSTPNRDMRRRRSQMIAQCLRLFPDEISMSLSRYPEAEWLFGRLYLVGALTRTQYEAAERLSEVVKRYRRLLAPHVEVKAFDPESMATFGQSPEDLSARASNRLLAVQGIYMEYYRALQNCGRGEDGMSVVRAVFAALDTDHPTGLDILLIKRGLNALTGVKKT